MLPESRQTASRSSSQGQPLNASSAWRARSGRCRLRVLPILARISGRRRSRMRMEWNGRLARRTAAALAVAAAAILTAQAPASAEPPVPADRPTFTAFLPNHTIAVGSAVKVATVWLSSNLVVDPVLTLDAGGL